MSRASFHIMLLFPGCNLITDCFVYMCNLYNVDSYKAVTVVFFPEHRRNRAAVHMLDEIHYATQTNPWQTVELLDRFLNLHTQINLINLLSKAYQM